MIFLSNLKPPIFSYHLSFNTNFIIPVLSFPLPMTQDFNLLQRFNICRRLHKRVFNYSLSKDFKVVKCSFSSSIFYMFHVQPLLLNGVLCSKFISYKVHFFLFICIVFYFLPFFF